MGLFAQSVKSRARGDFVDEPADRSKVGQTGPSTGPELEERVEIPRKLAIVEFEHGAGCTLGEPYGKCSPACTWTVVKFVSERPLSPEDLARHGLTVKTRRF